MFIDIYKKAYTHTHSSMSRKICFSTNLVNTHQIPQLYITRINLLAHTGTCTCAHTKASRWSLTAHLPTHTHIHAGSTAVAILSSYLPTRTHTTAYSSRYAHTHTHSHMHTHSHVLHELDVKNA